MKQLPGGGFDCDGGGAFELKTATQFRFVLSVTTPLKLHPDPLQPENYMLLEPHDWDAPDGVFRSSFEFEQTVAKSLQNVLDRAKAQGGSFSLPLVQCGSGCG